MTNQEIVSKLWNLCNILRDDGITYHQYVTELTYILFLKMAKETKTEDTIPEEYRWDKLVVHSGIELKKFYKDLLAYLGENTKGPVREIYQGASSNIDEPKNLENLEIQGFSGMWAYSHSIVPTGFGVRSKRTLFIPSTSAVIRLVIL